MRMYMLNHHITPWQVSRPGAIGANSKFVGNNQSKSIGSNPLTAQSTIMFTNANNR